MRLWAGCFAMRAEYTILAVAAPVAVIALELALLKTGLFRQARYWAALGIALAFMIPVDGWLTRADAEIVSYHDQAISGVRAPWNIPVEDYGFGFALITLTLLCWVRLSKRGAENA
jgi:lycopene cyclase domain-containing protein